jgi:dinuclear metal center YbgI/SA1388 family protein
MLRTELVEYLDSYLQVPVMEDFSNNGLQVEGASGVGLVAFAVDACQVTIDRAADLGAQMLVVHHGLFWGHPLPVVGPHRRRVKSLLDSNCSLYAVHLPLDGHKEVGNNVQLARVLGLEVTGPFREIGVGTIAPEGLSVEDLLQRVQQSLGIQPRLQSEGSGEVHRVAVMSGRATGEISIAAQEGFDTLITGEPLHDVFHDPAEYGINVIFAGHYATETLGLQALADHLEARFELETTFIDAPTGL